MRKLITVIIAALLAIAVAIGATMVQRGIPLSEFSLEAIFPKVTEEPESAEPQVKPAVPEENLSYDERMEKGQYFYDRGFITLAVNEFVKAANLAPDRTEPYYHLIDAHLELRDYEKIRRNAETILTLDPNDAEAYYYLVLSAVRQSNFDEAEAKLAEARQLGIADGRFDYYEALLLILQGQYEAAEVALSQAEESVTDETLLRYIDTLQQSYNEFDFAQAAEELYLSQLLARSFNQIDEYELSISIVKDILKERPDLRDSWILLGFSYLNLEKHYFALTAFEKAYDIDSEWPATQYFLGLSYEALEQNDKATLFYQTALENGFEPTQVIKRKLADLYLEQENYEKAVELYTDLVAYSEDDVSAYVRPIWLYLDFLNEPKKALSLAELAQQAYPESAMAYNLLGWSQTGTGNYEDAETNLLRAIELNPNFAAAQYNLGKLYTLMNQADLALDAFQKAYELDQNGSIGSLAAKRYNELLSQ